ncbi:hypothetical protein KN815_06405 [Streptomyces sp. 4503]|uniref:Uncharacterized protein n=1 Tax=Streptomyces niphimycinicus TaxID=2842201 RepID=A0ABS6C9Z3_9ACTN|nr:hypothetical protein [Streptomyces niphimycinicus]MBU3863727.1 hypothetical protein [Streptomyces niphimycinicus]
MSTIAASSTRRSVSARRCCCERDPDESGEPRCRENAALGPVAEIVAHAAGELGRATVLKTRADNVMVIAT